MRARYLSLMILVCSALLCGVPNGYGEEDTKSGWQRSMTAIEPPEEPPQIALNPGLDNLEVTTPNWVMAGSQVWLQNVTRASIIPYLAAGDGPHPSVILIPGGGFKFLSMSNEGWLIAERLVAAGVNVFLLKYRVDATPQDPILFQRELMSALTTSSISRDPSLYDQENVRRAREDAQRALVYLREHSAQFRIDPNKLGLLGFSAGAITAIAVALDNRAEEPPDWVGALYGSLIAVDVPRSPPPLFIAMASDDPLFNHEGFGLVTSWHDAGGATELHWYTRGGHGFGAIEQGTTSDRWLNQFLAWLNTL